MMQIRPGAPSDGPEIADLLLRHAPHMEVKGYPVGEWPEGVVVLVAVDDGHLVGWVEGVLDGAYTGPGSPARPPHGYVLGVVVDPEWRRRGAGRSLLDAFVAVASADAVPWVFLFPEEGAGVDGRVGFFEAVGFEPVEDPDEEHPAMGRWT